MTNCGPLKLGALDSTYQLTESADPAYPAPASLFVSALGCCWFANDSQSQWLTPYPNLQFGQNSPAGRYVYRTTFDLTGFDPSTARIDIQWAVDNQGTDILLNGVSTGLQTPGDAYGGFTSATITTGFLPGVNTLEFVTINSDQGDGTGGPFGLRVEGAVTAVGTAPRAYGISLYRLAQPEDEDTSGISGTVDVDQIIKPVADRCRLGSLPQVNLGMVADGVTPLIIRVEIPSTNAESATLSFSGTASGGTMPTITMEALQPSGWEVGDTADDTDAPSIDVPLTNGVGYAMIDPISAENLNVDASGSPAQIRATLSASSDYGNYSHDILFEKPPVILVHGMGSNSQAWTGGFMNELSAARPVTAIDYGNQDLPTPNGWIDIGPGRGCLQSLVSLAGAVDTKLTKTKANLQTDWAITRYDVVGQGQGGILLRMLCIAPNSAKYFKSESLFRSRDNFFRGRFRRIVAIAPPNNGQILTAWCLQLAASKIQLPLFGEDGTMILNLLKYLGLSTAKFDPFGAQMKNLNDPGVQLDSAAKFHLIATRVGGGEQPGTGPYITAYHWLLLDQRDIGSSLLPNGSDGVVEPEAALADLFATPHPNSPAGEIWTNYDLAHCPPSILYEANWQTQDFGLGYHIGALLDDANKDNFDEFPDVTTRDTDELDTIQRLSSSVSTESQIAEAGSNTSSRSRAATVQDGMSYHSYLLNVPADQIQAGSIEWGVVCFGANGQSNTGFTVNVSQDDPRNVTVSVQNDVVGDFAIAARYVSSKQATVIENPLLVQSNLPQASLTAIQLTPMDLELGVGETAALCIWRVYDDGSTAQAYIAGNSTVLTSSDSSVVEITDGMNITGVHSGQATITASLGGVQTQVIATVVALPPLAVPDTVALTNKNPIDIPVLANDEVYSGSGMIQSVTQPSYGSVAINGSNVTYTPGPLGAGLTSDSFTYTISDSDGTTNDATVTVQRPVPPGNNPPILALPNSPIVAEATSPSGASVQFSVTATDPEDGDLTPQLSNNSGDTFPIGTTLVTCSATDFYGVTTSGSFNVVVQDTTPPSISLNGRNPVTLGLGTNYVERGATATDLVSGSTSVSISGQVNTNQVGSYTITYTSNDAAGNTATATRVVNVVVPYAGLVDEGFGSGGAAVNFIGSDAGANAVAVQPDGKIVVAGYASVVGQNNFALVRYNIDGSVDTTFNGTGVVTTAIGSNDTAYSVAIQIDGKIVAAGSSQSNSVTSFALTRYNPDGSLDTTFNGSGKVTTSFGGNTSSSAAGVVVQPDGKIVAGGTFVASFPSDVRFAVARYNTDGSLDTGFNGTGQVMTDFGTFFLGMLAQASGVALQPDGKIVVVGTSVQGFFQSVFAAARYDTTGALDPSFDGTGKVLTAVGSTNDYGMSVAVQSDSKVVVGGYSEINGKDDFAVVRYNGDGSLDTSFNGTGKATTAIGNSDDEGRSLAIDSAGRIILGGYSLSSNAGADFALARYNTNGSLDTSFNTSGFVTTDLQGGDDFGYGLTLQPDGKIILVGKSLSGGQGTFGIVRYIGIPPVRPASVVSRKYHGTDSSAPYFDITLPLDPNAAGIECRRNTNSDTNGPNAGHDHELIVTFEVPISVGGGADVSPSQSGTATVTTTNNVMTVDLHDVPNAAKLNINLHGVSDGTNANDITIPMDVLAGDTTGDGAVNSADVSQTKSQSGQEVSGSNFREDVTCDGTIDSADVSLVKSKSGSALTQQSHPAKKKRH